MGRGGGWAEKGWSHTRGQGKPQQALQQRGGCGLEGPDLPKSSGLGAEGTSHSQHRPCPAGPRFLEGSVVWPWPPGLLGGELGTLASFLHSWHSALCPAALGLTREFPCLLVWAVRAQTGD